MDKQISSTQWLLFLNLLHAATVREDFHVELTYNRRMMKVILYNKQSELVYHNTIYSSFSSATKEREWNNIFTSIKKLINE